jgi:adenine/guanine phosphoribosyltransferase-like PRPP-binding protein
LTDISEAECRSRYGMVPRLKIYNDLTNIRDLYKETLPEGVEDEPFDMVVCSSHEASFLKSQLPKSYKFIVPGIRDEWMKKPDEHQKRVTGVAEAIRNGADFVVMGAQMMNGNPAFHISPEQSRSMTAFEIAKAKDKRTFDPDPLMMLKDCGGYYKSPIDDKGNFLGPLVGYAGTYDNGDDGKKNFVGFEYFNFAKAECIRDIRAAFASLIIKGITESDIPKYGNKSPRVDVLLGAPMGGIMLATQLGHQMNIDTIFAEKKVVALPELADGKRAIESLVIDRHDLAPGSRVVLVEDICNNFSTTQKVSDLLKEKNCELVAIVCAFNRSGKESWNGIPVIAACTIEAKQFKQNDPEVAEFIADGGHIIWKPKLEWEKLATAMKR